MLNNNIQNNNMTLNLKTFETIFDFNNMNIDALSIINKYSNGLVEEVIKCGGCDKKDIKNVDNFKNCCYSCEMFICMDCLELVKEGEYLEKDIRIENILEKDTDWICNECSCLCENCETYVCEDNMRGLLDLEGDYNYYCCYCINHNGLDINYKGECYLRNGSNYEDVYNIDIDNITNCGCEDYEEDCDSCNGLEKCGNCKIINKNAEDMLICCYSGDIICNDCNEINKIPFVECYECNNVYDCSEKNIYVINLEDKQKISICCDCVELDLHYC